MELARLREQKALESEAEKRRMLLLSSSLPGDSSQSCTRTDDEMFGKRKLNEGPLGGLAEVSGINKDRRLRITVKSGGLACI